MPSAIPCSLSLLLSLVPTLAFSRTEGVQVPSISTEELLLPRHARCVISRLRCNGHSLLLSFYLSRIGRIENLATPGPGPGKLPNFCYFMVFRHAPIPRKGSGNNNNNNSYRLQFLLKLKLSKISLGNMGMAHCTTD